MSARKRFLQFGFGTLVFMVFCVAGFFAGYRWGHETWREDHGLNAVSTKWYRVSSLVSQDRAAEELDQLVRLIQQSAGSWPQDKHYITVSHDDQSLMIKQTRDGHDQVKSFLDQLMAANARFRTRIHQGQCGYCGHHPAPEAGTACGNCNHVCEEETSAIDENFVLNVR